MAESDISRLGSRVRLHSPCDVRFRSEKPVCFPYGKLIFSYSKNGVQATFGDLTVPVSEKQMLRLCLLATDSLYRIWL